MATTVKKPAKSYKLVIVESPAKAKTIENFLGKGYKVVASNGHLIDLPKSKIGVDIENDFEPEYIVIRGRTAILNDLKKQAKEASAVYLATDPDREGEAISWHISNALKLDEKKPCRIEFNEITKNAVTNAIKHPRSINYDLVDAQQARRILDRLVGYQISPFLWKKVKRGLSAGRVQSATVRIIVERENEIRSFVPKEFWTVNAQFSDAKGEHPFMASFFGRKGKKVSLNSEEETKDLLNKIENSSFAIDEIKTGTKSKRPQPPFITSTLQQEAAKKLGFTTKKTMMIAQALYEGIQLSAKETVGLISYMRTDSTRISKEAQDMARDYILETYGKEYVPAKPNVYVGRKNAQDAHEAIRPTHIKYEPKLIKDSLTTDQYKLYNLIYSRFLASQMVSAEYSNMTYQISDGEYMFRAIFSKQIFNGYQVVYQESVEETDEEEVNKVLPPMKEGEKLKIGKLNPKQNFTAAPLRFTEASLVKMLEEKGIGRPSTYAPIISTIIERQYVKKDKRSIVPTELGEIVTDLMKNSFPDIVNVEFTAEMEEKLDSIETDHTDWKKIMREFYAPLSEELKKAEAEVERVKLPDRPAGVICENCGAEMVIKVGRFGEFIACPNYPKCKNTKPLITTIKTPCPQCGGTIVQKRSKKGTTFYGCENYPTCTFVSWDMPLDDKCPHCGSYMVLKRGKGTAKYKKCSNPNCPGDNKNKKED